MSAPYVPKSVYPLEIDSDFTLYKVYNTSETVLSQDLNPFESTIHIQPVDADKQELWADNGFCNINGELIYYHSVIKDIATNKITTFQQCIRNLGGAKPEFCPAGTDVRGFVIAEHHNQIARSLVNVENFIGYQENPDKATLDWRIRNMALQSPIVDDFGCPDVNFSYFIVSSDNITGTTINYSLDIVGTGYVFEIQFGDGKSTTTEKNGTHVYAPNTIIDPIVSVTTNTCEQAVSGLIREQGDQPQGAVAAVAFEVLIPETPTLPDINADVDNIVPNNILQPPIVFPCVDASFGPIVVPSIINIDPPVNFPSIISFGDLGNIPSFIEVGPLENIPSVINISPALVSTNLDLNLGNICVTCFPEITVTNGVATSYPSQTPAECCDNNTGSSKISNLQVVIHDLKLSGNNDYGFIKMLLESPSGKTCLLMGSANGTSNLTDTVTLTFSDAASDTIYSKFVGSGTYKPSPNGNQNSRTAGRANLAGSAPAPSYGTLLADFNDDTLGGGRWKLYVVSGNTSMTVSIKKVCLKVSYGVNNVCLVPSSPSTPASPATPVTPTPATPVTPTPATPATPTPPLTPQAVIACTEGLDVAFVLDYTGSLSEKINTLKNSINDIATYVKNISKDNYQLGLSIFDEYCNGYNIKYAESSLYHNLPASQKYILRTGSKAYQVITALEKFSLRNLVSFNQKLSSINLPASFPLGEGCGSPEPSDINMDLVARYKFLGQFRSTASKVIILITDTFPGNNLDSYTNKSDILIKAVSDACVYQGIRVIFINVSSYNIPVYENLAAATKGVVIKSTEASSVISALTALCGEVKTPSATPATPLPATPVSPSTPTATPAPDCGSCDWFWDFGLNPPTGSWYQTTYCNSAACSCDPPAVPGLAQGQPDTTSCKSNTPSTPPSTPATPSATPATPTSPSSPTPDSGCVLKKVSANRIEVYTIGELVQLIELEGSVDTFLGSLPGDWITLGSICPPSGLFLILGKNGPFKFTMTNVPVEKCCIWNPFIFQVGARIDPRLFARVPKGKVISADAKLYDKDNTRLGLVDGINAGYCTAYPNMSFITAYSDNKSDFTQASFGGWLYVPKQYDPTLGYSVQKYIAKTEITGTGENGPIIFQLLKLNECNLIGFGANFKIYDENDPFYSDKNIINSMPSLNGYILGGRYVSDLNTNTIQPTNTSQKINFVTQSTSYQTSANLATASVNAAACSGNNLHGYIAGGFTTATSKAIQKLTYSTSTTSAITPTLIGEKQNHSGMGNYLNTGYFLGGSNLLGLPTESVEKIDYSTDAVQSMIGTKLTSPRINMTSLSASSSKGYVLGGLESEIVSLTEKMSFLNDIISLCSTASLSVPLIGAMGLDGQKNNGYCLYGFNTTATTNVDKIVFATDTKVIVDSANLSTPRSFGVGLSDRYSNGYACGGVASTNFSTAIFSITDQFSFGFETASVLTSADLVQSRSNAVGLSACMADVPSIGGYVTGGSDNTYLSSTEKLSYAYDASYIAYSAILSSPKDFVAACSGSSEAAYIGGGYTGSGINTIDKFAYGFDTVQSLTSSTLSTNNYSASTLNDSVDSGYFLGGNTGTATASIQVFSYSSETASTLASQSLSQSRYGASTITNYLKGYICGGQDQTNAYFNIIDVLNYNTATISLLGTGVLNPVRSYASSFDFGGYIGFVLGGINGSGYLQSTNAINFITGIVSSPTTASLLTTRAYSAGVSNKVAKGFVTGGSNATTPTFGSTEKFDYASTTISASAQATLQNARKNIAGFDNFYISAPASYGSYIIGNTTSLHNSVRFQKILYQTDITCAIFSYEASSPTNFNSPTVVSSCSGNKIAGYIQMSSSGNEATITSPFKFFYDFETYTSVNSAALSTPRIYSTGLASCGYAGYFCGGSNPSASDTFASNTDIILYGNDTAYSMTTADLSQGRYGSAGMSDSDKSGYISGGFSRAPVKTTDKLVFSTNTTTNMGTVELTYGRQNTSGCDGQSSGGYVSGGYSSTYLANTEKLIYSLDIFFATTTASISVARSDLAGSSERFTKGYFSGGNNGAASIVTDKIIFSNNTSSSIASASLVYDSTSVNAISANNCYTGVTGNKGYSLGTNTLNNNGALTGSSLAFNFISESFESSLSNLVFSNSNKYIDQAPTNKINGVSNGSKGIIQWYNCTSKIHDEYSNTINTCVGEHSEFNLMNMSTGVASYLYTNNFSLGGYVVGLDGNPSKGYFTAGGVNSLVTSSTDVNCLTSRVDYINQTLSFVGSANLKTRSNGRAGISGNTRTSFITGGYNLLNTGIYEPYNGCVLPLLATTETIDHASDTSFILSTAVLQEPRCAQQTVARLDTKAYLAGGQKLNFGGYDTVTGSCIPITLTNPANTEVLDFSTRVFSLQPSANLSSPVVSSTLDDRYNKGYFLEGQIIAGANISVQSINYSTNVSATATSSFGQFFAGNLYPQTGLNEYPYFYNDLESLETATSSFPTGSISVIGEAATSKFVHATETWNHTAINDIFVGSGRGWSPAAPYNNSQNPAYLSGNTTKGYIEQTRITYSTEVATKITQNITDLLYNVAGFGDGNNFGYIAECGGIFGADLAQNYVAVTNAKMSKVTFSTDTSAAFAKTIPVSNTAFLSGFATLSKEQEKALIVGVAKAANNTVMPVAQFVYATETASTINLTGTTAWNSFAAGYKGRPLTTQFDGISYGYIKAYNTTTYNNSDLYTNIFVSSSVTKLSYATNTYSIIAYTNPEIGDGGGDFENRGTAGYGSTSPVQIKCLINGSETLCQRQVPSIFKFSYTTESFSSISPDIYLSSMKYEAEPIGSMYCGLSPYVLQAVSFAFSQDEEVVQQQEQVAYDKFYIIKLKNGKNVVINMEDKPEANYYAGPFKSYEDAMNFQHKQKQDIEVSHNIGYVVRRDQGYEQTPIIKKVHSNLPNLETNAKNLTYSNNEDSLSSGLPKLESSGMGSKEIFNDLSVNNQLQTIEIEYPKSNLPKLDNIVKIVPADSHVTIDTKELME